MTWTQAQRYCRAIYTDLATITSMDDISRLNRTTVGPSAVWIGLNDDPNSWAKVMTNDANSWRWSLGGQTNNKGYQAWSSSEPNDRYIEYCGVMYSDGSWNDYSCGALSTFVCFTGKKKKAMTSLVLFYPCLFPAVFVFLCFVALCFLLSHTWTHFLTAPLQLPATSS